MDTQLKVGDTLKDRDTGKRWIVDSIGGTFTLVSYASGVKIAMLAEDVAESFTVVEGE